MADALATTGTKTLAKRESFIDSADRTGTEDITQADLRLPRLSIAQGLSPQKTPGNAEYIKGLELGELFNDLTSEVYGSGPIRFIPVKRAVRRIEFDRVNRNVPIDMNVPADDLRCQWSVDPDSGKRLPPRAVKFVEFVVLLLRENEAPEPIVLSIKAINKWNRKAADRLTTFITLRQKPIYAGYYTISSTNVTNDKGTFGVYVVKNDGNLDDPAQSDEQWDKSSQLYKLAEEFHQNLKGKEIEVAREAPDDSTDFEVDPETDEVR